MSTETAGGPEVSPEEQAGFREYWGFYSSRLEAITAATRARLQSIPEVVALLNATPPEQAAAEQQRNRERQRAALVDGAWGPYLEQLRSTGGSYARAGMRFATWFKILTIFRDVLRDELSRTQLDAPALLRISGAMDRFVDISLEVIGESYLETKERTIQQQQQAIRELSTPVLQVRDKLLIIPIVGLVDTQRARHLTQSLLGSIRQRRARLVVMDITGVPIVDSKVANHLVQACEAARLMGTRVVLSGVSPEIAQALVTLGADLPGVVTVVDLQTALEDGDRWLADGATLEEAAEP
ncbi:MAG TPA: STAS domain-containing protein [Myxococcales bacterium]|nr:STAS domain-containing protein [Myxococcales bacterium]